MKIHVLQCFVIGLVLLACRTSYGQGLTTVDVVSESANYPQMECLDPENGQIDCPSKMKSFECGKNQDGTPRVCVGGGTADLGTCQASTKINYFCQHVGYYFEEGEVGSGFFKKRGCRGKCEREVTVCGYAPNDMSCHGDFRWYWIW